MLKKIGNVIINLIIFVLSIIAIISVYCIIQLNVLNKEYINLLGYSYFQVSTGSMSKTIEIDDIIIVKLDNNNIEKNDIITFKSDENLVTHRVIDIKDDTYITKGDNNNTEDDPIKKDDIIGKVIFIINNVKVWKYVFSNIQVILSLSITVILFVLIIFYKEKVGEKND